jgi:hypothetical protein
MDDSAAAITHAVALLFGACGFLLAAYGFATGAAWGEMGFFEAVFAAVAFFAMAAGVGFGCGVVGLLVGFVLAIIVSPFTKKH